MDTRTFGVEIETCIPRSKKEQIWRNEYDGEGILAFPDWNASGDSSICPPYGYFGAELRSPILSGPGGLDQVKRVLTFLQELGAQANSSTGLHVHVGAEDLDERQVRSVRRAFIRYEKALLGLNGRDAPNRVRNDFAALSPTWRNERDLEGNRYRSLNTSNWAYYRGRQYKNTLECRLWQSTLAEHRVMAAIQFFVALVSRAAAITSRTYQRIEDTEEATQTFIRNHYGPGLRSRDVRITAEPVESFCLAALEEAHASVLAGV